MNGLTDLTHAAASGLPAVPGGTVLAEGAHHLPEVFPASGVFSLGWLLIALPLAGAAVLLLGGRRLDRVAPVLGTATVLGAFGLAVSIFAALLGRDAEQRVVEQQLYSFIPVNAMQIDVGVRLDQLSILFALLITGVGAMIHVYSIGYMAHDPRRRRFFAYLNLFVAAMLLLVLANDYVLTYVGWEGVGLASYLLIGFWQHKPSAAVAAKKAFVVNRVGDLGLSIGIMVMFATVGATSFTAVHEAAGEMATGTALAIGLLLLLAACGKSAQFPLQTWLLDAMEGPTPVSALIHAATMVTAGVYLIVRSAPVFDASEGARAAVAVIGVITLLLGAFIGTAMDDIKKALAASTMSQIGYMVLAAGLGPAGYAFAILHLITHGFFKATMFLGAGSVMHAMNDQVDMRRFGGLRKVMPLTFATFGVGYLAIIGVPPFAGFFSKDKIIEAAFDAPGATGWVLGAAALLGAGLTAFYMTRVVVMTFFGPRRWTEDVHPHESPRVMTWPMIVLAVGALVSGGLLLLNDWLPHWLAPVVGEEPEVAHRLPVIVVTGMALTVTALGVGLALREYARRPVPTTAPVAVTALTRAARRNAYGDAVVEGVVMRPGQYLTRSLVWADNKVVDGLVTGLGAAVAGSASRMRRLQNGFVRSYALAVAGGAAVVVAAVLLGGLS